MLNSSEKAYCLALQALRRKDFRSAAGFFEKAAPFFKDNKEFNLYRETTRLLIAVKEELAVAEDDDELIIEEAFFDGQETDIRG